LEEKLYEFRKTGVIKLFLPQLTQIFASKSEEFTPILA